MDFVTQGVLPKRVLHCDEVFYSGFSLQAKILGGNFCLFFWFID